MADGGEAALRGPRPMRDLGARRGSRVPSGTELSRPPKRDHDDDQSGCQTHRCYAPVMSDSSPTTCEPITWEHRPAGSPPLTGPAPAPTTPTLPPSTTPSSRAARRPIASPPSSASRSNTCARAHGCSSANLTTQLATLERASGGPLIQRHAKPFPVGPLTPLGRDLCRQAQDHLGISPILPTT